MPVYSRSTLNAAMTLIGQYGDDAEIIATLRAAEFAALDDVDGLAAWDEIIACVAAIAMADTAELKPN